MDPGDISLKAARQDSFQSLRHWLKTDQPEWYATLEQPPEKRVRNMHMGRAIGKLSRNLSRSSLKPDWASGKLFFKQGDMRAVELAQYTAKGWAVRDAAMQTHAAMSGAAFLELVG